MSDLYVYMFRSRNKDNKDIPNFKERCKTILEHKYCEDNIIKKYQQFVQEGLPGEQTRLYRSVNSRNGEKIREALIIRLIKDKPDMANINRVLASVAQQVENRDESKWLFDFDCTDEEKLDEFICDLPVDSSSYQTPNGYAIVVEHGFDTRELMEKWKDYDITLKKDELLFLRMEKKE